MKNLGLIIAAFGLVVGSGCNAPTPATTGNSTVPPATANLVLKSTAFADNAAIPAAQTCDGTDTSPALEWSGAPKGTKSFALTCVDPDAPSGTFTHWIVYRIPATATRLPEGLPKSGETLKGIRQGKNDFGKLGYGGPCPPAGKLHHYRFSLHALDAELTLKSGASFIDLENAIQFRKIATAQYTGTYRK